MLSPPRPLSFPVPIDVFFVSDYSYEICPTIRILLTLLLYPYGNGR